MISSPLPLDHHYCRTCITEFSYFLNHLLSIYGRTATHTSKSLKWRNWSMKCFIMESFGWAHAISHPRSCWLRRTTHSDFVWTTVHSTTLLSKVVSLSQWSTKSLMSSLEHISWWAHVSSLIWISMQVITRLISTPTMLRRRRSVHMKGIINSLWCHSVSPTCHWHFRPWWTPSSAKHTEGSLLSFKFDDILIYSPSWTHMEHLHIVLTLLHSRLLFTKLTKHEFGCSEIGYLGHRISSKGVVID